MPLQRSEIKAVLLYLFTEPQGFRHNGSPVSLSLCVRGCLSKVERQEVSPTLTVTTSEPDTYSDAFLSLIAGALFSWKTQPFHFSQILFFFFYAQHVLQKIAKKKKKITLNR